MTWFKPTAQGGTTTVSWSTTSDWDGAQSELGVHHEQPTGTDWAASDVVEKGWPGSDWSNWSVPKPFLFWPLQEASGTTANDVTGNGRDGTISGTTLGASGILGNSAGSFDGTDDRIDVTFTADTLSYPFTLAVWSTGANASGEVVLSAADKDVSDQQHRLKTSGGGKWEVSTFDGTLYDAATSTVSSGYQLAAARFVSNSERRIQKNDGADNVDTSTASVSGLDRITAGVSADSSPFGFWPDDVTYAVVWNEDLSQTQIADLYTAVVGTSEHWTSKQTGTGSNTTITVTTTTTIPASTSITLTLYEDVGNDGSGANTDAIGNSYDNSASVTLTGGTDETNDLAGFDGGGSTNAYWVLLELAGDGTDPTLESPTVDSVEAAL